MQLSIHRPLDALPCPAMSVIEEFRASLDPLSALRRDLHAHPELCFEERRTSDVVARTLESCGIEVHRGWAKTGLVGVIRGRPGPRAVGLRADMDALPITERNTFAHASRPAGKMHACGHDGHVAMLLGAAQYLAAHRDFDGTVYLLFQPAEEGGGGARLMVEEGLFQRFQMDAVFGMHNWPGFEVGKFAVNPGPVMASSNEFRIRIRGKGSHAALPHNGIDPVPVACQIVQALQTIVTRNKHPLDTAVISVSMIHAGEASNAMPESATIRGTVRTFTTAVLDLVERRMRTIAESTCAAFEARCEFGFHRNYPPTVNHAAETEFVRKLLAEVAGQQNVDEFVPTMGAEDFSYFLQARPGCYFLIGNGDGSHRESAHGLGPCSLHNPSYDFNDELIPLGATVWVRLAEKWLATPRAAG
jgi:hippurate hydrolase